MTVLEIAQYAERLYLDDEEITEDEDNYNFILTAINDGIKNLSPSAFSESDTEIVAEEDTWYSLPSTCVRIVEIRVLGEKYAGIVEIRSGKIRFQDAGTYTVYYKQLPALLTLVSQTPSVHEAYHSVLAKYVAGSWKTKDDDENPDGIRLQQEFYKGCYATDAMLRRMARNETLYRPSVRVERI